MVTSIASSLGAGSGIDIATLVSDLSAASREPKVTRLSGLITANTARVSAVSQARSDLVGFADSLEQMIADGSLRSKLARLQSDHARVETRAVGALESAAKRIEKLAAG